MSTTAPYSQSKLYGRYLRQCLADQSLPVHTVFRICIAIICSFGFVDSLRFYHLPHHVYFTGPASFFAMLLMMWPRRRIYHPLPLDQKRTIPLLAVAKYLHSIFLLLAATMVHLLLIDSLWLFTSEPAGYLLAALLRLCGAVSLFFSADEQVRPSLLLIPAGGALPLLWGLMSLGWVDSPQEILGATLLILVGAIWWFSKSVPTGLEKPKIWTWGNPPLSQTASRASRQLWLDMLVPKWWPIVLAPLLSGLVLEYFLEGTIFPSLIVGLLAGLVFVCQIYVPAVCIGILELLPVPAQARATAATLNGWLTVIVPLVTYLLLRSWAPTNDWVGAVVILVGAIAIPNMATMTIPELKYRPVVIGAAIAGGALVLWLLGTASSTTQLLSLGLCWVLLKDAPALVVLAIGDRK